MLLRYVNAVSALAQVATATILAARDIWATPGDGSGECERDCVVVYEWSLLTTYSLVTSWDAPYATSTKLFA